MVLVVKFSLTYVSGNISEKVVCVFQEKYRESRIPPISNINNIWETEMSHSMTLISPHLVLVSMVWYGKDRIPPKYILEVLTPAAPRSVNII